VDAPGDLNESLMIGPVDVSEDPYYTAPEAGRHFHPNLWPSRPEALRPAYEAYFRAMGTLAEDLMAMFALALDLPEPFFADKIDRHISRLRVRNYPAPTAPPKPGQLRAGAHCDYGSLTILRTEDKPGGLQVLNHAEEWVDVPVAPDSFIINIGELMARWTNERWGRTCIASLIRRRTRPRRAGGCRSCSSTIRITTHPSRLCQARRTARRRNIRPRPRASICRGNSPARRCE
jgi:isopenicillin N synthase-like dioxygenase